MAHEGQHQSPLELITQNVKSILADVLNKLECGDVDHSIVAIRWNAVSTEVRINVKYHRGINQCHIASDKIIEVRSNGRKVRSNGMKVRSNGRKVRSNGMEVRSNGRKVRSNGTRIRSNGMQVAIRLHFCPECPSINAFFF